MPWKCFLIERTGTGAVVLRRYSRERTPEPQDSACPVFKVYGYHNANIMVEERPFPADCEWEGSEILIPKADPRWPKTCDCGYAFKDTDYWQSMLERQWKGVRDGVEIKGVLGAIGPQLPPGAMWLAGPGDLGFWDHLAQPERGGRLGPDGKFLFVRLPGSSGVFCPDGPAWDASGTRPCPWTRTGEVPDSLVVSPSIRLGNSYHGYIGQNGVSPGWVTDDVDGRKHDANGKAIQ